MTLLTSLSVAFCAFAGFGSLCLAMDRHYQDVFGRGRHPSRPRLLRVTGWLLLALALLGSVAVHGWPYGSVLWLGALTIAALLLVYGLLPYRPHWVPRATLLAALLAVAGTLSALALQPAQRPAPQEVAGDAG